MKTLNLDPDALAYAVRMAKMIGPTLGVVEFGKNTQTASIYEEFASYIIKAYLDDSGLEERLEELEYAVGSTFMAMTVALYRQNNDIKDLDKSSLFSIICHVVGVDKNNFIADAQRFSLNWKERFGSPEQRN